MSDVISGQSVWRASRVWISLVDAPAAPPHGAIGDQLSRRPKNVHAGLTPRRQVLNSLLVLCVMLLGGCIIPMGRATDREIAVASRTNATDGAVVTLKKSRTYHYVMLPVSAEGPQFRYPYRETYRYYMHAGGGERKELAFLRVTSPYALWHRIMPIPGSRLWIAVGEAGIGADCRDRVLVFEDDHVVRERFIEGGAGAYFDPAGLRFHYKNGYGVTCSYDPVNDVVIVESPLPISD